MSEEDQIKAAMELSMRDAGFGGADPGGAGAGSQGGQAAAAPARPVMPGQTKPRAFPGKDPQDALPPPPRSSAKKQRGEPRVGEQAGSQVRLGGPEVAELMQLLFGDAPDPQDVERWLSIGFMFSPLQGTEWGLWQRHGGPCGVFAAVQAFIVKHLLFGGVGGEAAVPEAVAQQRKDQPLAVAAEEEDMRGPLLAYALASVLYHATPSSSYTVCQVAPTAAADTDSPEAAASSSIAAAIASGGTSGLTITGCRVARAADAQQLLEEGVDAWLAGPCGVLSFVCSVLLSRVCATVREDMDDPQTPLIGRYGHCSQELVNLMLIGEAASNVFDGSRWLGDDPSSGFLVKGVDGDRVGVPHVGFLSELEPMRYLCVGALYKHPEYPIWVLGSPTHYTLLFSARRSDSQLSEEAQFEQRVKKVFVDHAFDEGGLAMATTLGKMIEALGVNKDRLPQAETELVREEVILWDDFRSWACRQFGFSDGPARGDAALSRLKLFLYDGQDPPGPSLRSVLVELNDIDPLLAGGGADGDAFAATLHTRWPNAVVMVKPIAGAGAEDALVGGSGSKAC